MQELVNKVFKEKMENGDIEAIVSKKIDELVNCSLHSLFTYDGPIKKQMQEKLNECMSNVLKSTKFDEYVVKLSAVIDGCLNDTSLRDYKEIVDTIKTICGPKLDYSEKVINASDLFNKYCTFIEELSIDYIDLDDDVQSEMEEGYAHLDVEMRIVGNHIIFETSGFVDYEDYCCVVSFYESSLRGYEGCLALTGISNIKPGELNDINKNSSWDIKEIGLKELNRLNEFELYLVALSSSYVKVRADETYFNDEVSIKI